MRLNTLREGVAWWVVAVSGDFALDVVVTGLVVSVSDPGGSTAADEGATGPVKAGSPAYAALAFEVPVGGRTV
jgi:hypothetical protein